MNTFLFLMFNTIVILLRNIWYISLRNTHEHLTSYIEAKKEKDAKIYYIEIVKI